MYLAKKVGCYDISIDNGILDYSNHWYYNLKISKVNSITNKVEESKTFYIKGHKEGREKQKGSFITELYRWFKYVKEEEVAEMFSHQKNYKFSISVPKKCTLI